MNLKYMKINIPKPPVIYSAYSIVNPFDSSILLLPFVEDLSKEFRIYLSFSTSFTDRMLNIDIN
jgi:hypothetical protein